MKRLLLASFLAVAVLATTRQDASAWCKFNFGVGLGFNYEGGGNNLLWGLVKTAPYPGAPASAAPGCGLFGGNGCGLFGRNCGMNQTPGLVPYGYGTFAGPGYGGYPLAGDHVAPGGDTYVAPAPTPTKPETTPKPTPKSAAPVAPPTTQRVGYYTYGQAGYNYNNAYNYNCGYGYNYGYQAPSYWYGD